eukprot:7389124-Prymnesium_polylepis.5
MHAPQCPDLGIPPRAKGPLQIGIIDFHASILVLPPVDILSRRSATIAGSRYKNTISSSTVGVPATGSVAVAAASSHSYVSMIVNVGPATRCLEIPSVF